MTDALPSGYQPLLHERYGGAGIGAALCDNDIVAALLRHRSVRGYLPTRLPAGTIETLVAAAQSAPTSSNLQTWSVVAVEDEARRGRLSALAQNQAFIREAPLFLAWIADLSRLDRVGQVHGRHLEGLDYLEMFMVAAIDAALAAQNAVVAAESLGLGTCYVGALRNHPEKVAAELGLPPAAMAVFGLAVGYPAPGAEGAVKPRLSQHVVLHREQYGAPSEQAAVDAYDQALAAFSEATGQGRTTWTGRVMTRVGTLAGLSGRERMQAALNALGFPLR
jgi:nitroreductase